MVSAYVRSIQTVLRQRIVTWFLLGSVVPPSVKWNSCTTFCEFNAFSIV